MGVGAFRGHLESVIGADVQVVHVVAVAERQRPGEPDCDGTKGAVALLLCPALDERCNARAPGLRVTRTLFGQRVLGRRPAVPIAVLVSGARNTEDKSVFVNVLLSLVKYATVTEQLGLMRG